jgi:hypothetical protein
MNPDDEDKVTDGSKAVCGGTIGDELSTLTFDMPDTSVDGYKFNLKSPLKPSKTGTYDAILRIDNRHLFTGSWQSTSGQCKLEVKAYSAHKLSAQITGVVTCKPPEIPNTPSPNPSLSLTLDQFEFTAEILVQQ